MEFGNTKWFVRDWTEEQKVQFQEKCFELGYAWSHTGKGKYKKGFDFLYINRGGYITFMLLDFNCFKRISHVEKTWEDMFPIPKLDVSKEIATLVFEALGKIEEEIRLEEEVTKGVDEEGFDNLKFVQVPKLGASIPMKNLSQDQLEFIINKFGLRFPEADKTHVTFLPTTKGRDSYDNYTFTGHTSEVYYSMPRQLDKDCYNLSFNDFFKEV